jgi:Sulfotransferase family
LSQTDYGRLDRLLHQFALGSGFIAKASFEMESISNRAAASVDIQKPVYISGLARSGSTILLNALYQTGIFRSLTYRDMPFILMPSVWHKLSAGSQTNREARERAHGDRLLVEYDSPEAFEEVFWRNFLGDKYIEEDRLTPHKALPSVRKDYRSFVSHVLSSCEDTNQTRYLCKNNNNLLRLPSLRKTFPDAALLVPFRDPLQQAISLHKQHMQFSELHASDKFSRKYMEWLGHYEFGLGQKHYCYAEQPPSQPREDINYWVQSWIDAYSFALKDQSSGLIFAGYEPLCEAPLRGFTKLFELLDLDMSPEPSAAFYERAGEGKIEGVSAELLTEAEDVYRQLLDKHAEKLG